MTTAEEGRNLNAGSPSAGGWSGRVGLLLAAILAGSGMLVCGQERTDSGGANAPTSTNAAAETGELSRTNDVAQTNEVTQAEELSATNSLGSTNNSPAAMSPTRTEGGRGQKGQGSQGRRQDRRETDQVSRSSGVDSSSEMRPDQTGGSPRASAATSARNAPARLDYSAFRLITERNIFDPNRVPRRSNRVKPRTVESFGLVGVMSYEKGTFAFFDGTSSEYRKVLKMADAIAGYKVASIAANSVKLFAGTNIVELSVGAQLRREDGGEWVPSARPDTYAAASSPSSPTSSAEPASASSGVDSDILKKLAQRREQE